MGAIGIRVGVVIAARNEELYLEKTLQHLLEQTLRPDEIVVVDDGSTDRTAEIARKHNAKVISLRDRGYDVVGSPILLKVRNIGLQALSKRDEFEYIMVLDADHILPKRYLATIISRMEKTLDLAIASGRFLRQKWYPDAPIESGRIYRSRFFRDIGFFPVNHAGEDYPLFKAVKMGCKIVCFEDLPTLQQRPIKLSRRKLFYLGKGMKALGYDPLYFSGKFAIMFLKSPGAAIGMLSGYMSPEVKKYSDLKGFTKYWQRQKLFERVRNLINPQTALG